MLQRFNRNWRAPLADTDCFHRFYLTQRFDVSVDLGVNSFFERLLSIGKHLMGHFLVKCSFFALAVEACPREVDKPTVDRRYSRAMRRGGLRRMWRSCRSYFRKVDLRGTLCLSAIMACVYAIL